MSPLGGQEIRLSSSDGLNSRSPVWGPTGEDLAFVEGEESASQVCRIRLSDRSTQTLTLGHHSHGSPSWSPDGLWIAYRSDPISRDEIWKVSVSGGSEIPVLFDSASDRTEPDWSPDGNWIATLRDSTQICVVPARGGIEILLTESRVPRRGPKWSPDGQWIATACAVSGYWQIYKVSPSGRTEIAMTGDDCDHLNPVWSPDGRWVAYTKRDANGAQQIYKVPAQGGLEVALTGDATEHQDPAWSPDSVWITYSRPDQTGFSQIYKTLSDRCAIGSTPTRAPSAPPSATMTKTPTATSTSTTIPAPFIIQTHRDKHLPIAPHLSEWVDLTFESSPGMGYDVYASPSLASPVWTFQGAIRATGALTTYRDQGPVFEERYYRVAVQGTNPVLTSWNEAGVLPISVAGSKGLGADGFEMVGVSLEGTEASETIQDVLGWQTFGARDPEAATEACQYAPLTREYESAWLFDSGANSASMDGSWLNRDLSGLSAMAMTLGSGFWVCNKTPNTQTIFFDGLVRNTEFPIEVHVDPSFVMAHQIGQPFAMDVALDEKSTSLMSDGAAGGMDPDASDEIWVWDAPTVSYRFAWLFNSSGAVPSLDGAWIDPNLGAPSSMVLERGAAWWYLSKPNPAQPPIWRWTEPLPY